MFLSAISALAVSLFTAAMPGFYVEVLFFRRYGRESMDISLPETLTHYYVVSVPGVECSDYQVSVFYFSLIHVWNLIVFFIYLCALVTWIFVAFWCLHFSVS